MMLANRSLAIKCVPSSEKEALDELRRYLPLSLPFGHFLVLSSAAFKIQEKERPPYRREERALIRPSGENRKVWVIVKMSAPNALLIRP
jgi:hypothetical protein